MNEIKYNIFSFDEYSQSYPYIIEDCAISYILYLNKIPFTECNYMISDNYDNYNNYNMIACHTNKYK